VRFDKSFDNVKELNYSATSVRKQIISTTKFRNDMQANIQI